MTVLGYHTTRSDPGLQAVLEFVFDSLGIVARRVQPPALWDGPHLIHGDPGEVRANGIAIPDRPPDVLWRPLLDGSVLDADGRLDFHLLAAIGAFRPMGRADPAGRYDRRRLAGLVAETLAAAKHEHDSARGTQ